ncbi:MAG: hypothetical protein GX386_10340 [Clostridiaceae bacterium]|jgi:hypothetical protein|nr:hypothetical protein [Clostridiaceae bacterium]
MIENVNNELKKYFESKPVISSLLGFDMIILYGCVALMLLNSFVYLGGIISGILFYIFILAVLLCLAKNNFNALMVGLGVKVLIELISFRYGFYWSTLYAVLIYGFFAFMAYKKSMVKK